MNQTSSDHDCIIVQKTRNHTTTKIVQFNEIQESILKQMRENIFDISKITFNEKFENCLLWIPGKQFLQKFSDPNKVAIVREISTNDKRTFKALINFIELLQDSPEILDITKQLL